MIKIQKMEGSIGMRKRISVFLVLVMIIALFNVGGLTGPVAEAAVKPVLSKGYYGDRLDVDSHLDYLSGDAVYRQSADAKVKAQAPATAAEAEAATDNGDFTYDGGTKYFLNYELDFKTFTLRSEGDQVEIWVADDISFQPGDPRPTDRITQEQVDKLRDEFDRNIYPVATSFFGTPEALDGSQSLLTEWGMFPEGYYGGSNKVIILVDNVKDENYYDPTYPFFIAGFFWQTLESYINRNIITIDTRSWETRLENTFYPTAIHELQHLIHADNDPYEESWINEGMSTFSEYLGGYGMDAGSINYYLDRPENSLVKWDDHYAAATGPETIADYGQVYLFTLYMNDKLGQSFIHDLAVNKAQGITSIEQTLAAHGSKLDFTQLYQDFITALVLDSDKPGNGIYNFDSINLRDIPVDSAGTKRGKTVDFESAAYYEKEGVPAWGGDFKLLDFKDKIRSISFDGVDFLPTPWKTVEDPLGSGEQVLWGNEGDEADNALILEADLSQVPTATLNFDNFLQIEDGWDYGFVQVSTDGGYSWTSLANEHTRSDLDASGYPEIRNNLPGFTGYYDGWTPETFDLSAYAGQKILIAFRYMTDWSYNDPGWYIDNIRIPEINLFFDGGTTEGFVSLNELMGQYVNYTVTFINVKSTGNKKAAKTEYKVVTIDPFNVTEADALNIRNLFKEGTNYMITTYAAQTGDRDPVFFTYEVHLKQTGQNKVKKKNK